MKRILFAGVAGAAALAGSIALAAPAMASNGPVTANTHLNNHPDTTSVTGGAIQGNTWALDNATEKFTITPEAGKPDTYLVTMDYVGSFHGFADPRMFGEDGGDGLGSALVSDGSVKGTIAYDVVVPAGSGQQPDPANLPGQVPSDTHISQNIATLFDNNTDSITQVPGSYIFTYHKVAGIDYVQVG